MPPVRSSSKNRVEEIEMALKAANEHAVEACGRTLHSMPEYFLCTRVGEHLAHRFANFRYRLEASVAEILERAPLSDDAIDVLTAHDEMRLNGRFDLAIFTKKRQKPAHIIEFKKGTKFQSLKADINRIALLGDAVHMGSRLETNYLVFITKRHITWEDQDWENGLQRIVDESVIGKKELANAMTCTVRKVWREYPTSDQNLLQEEHPFSVVIVELRSKY